MHWTLLWDRNGKDIYLAIYRTLPSSPTTSVSMKTRSMILAFHPRLTNRSKGYGPLGRAPIF